MKIDKSLQFVCRLITACAILGITAFFTPGFTISNVGMIAIEIFALTIVDFLIGCFTKIYYHPYIKFLIGFILSGITLYMAQYFIIGYILSYIPIILGAIIFGLVDYILPSDDINKADKPSKHDNKRNSKNDKKLQKDQ